MRKQLYGTDLWVFETLTSKLVPPVMHAIVKQPGVKSINGGGDSAAAAINLGRADKFSWDSTGRKAYIFEGKEPPGLAAISLINKSIRMTRAGKPTLFCIISLSKV